MHDLDSGLWVVKEPGRPSLFGPVRAGRSWVVCRDCGWQSGQYWGDGAWVDARAHRCLKLTPLPSS
jgi:hypothetical protein